VSVASPERPIRISRRSWRSLVAELATRGGGRRESGAALLAKQDEPTMVTRIVYFDDVDGRSLRGGIDVRFEGMVALTDICRRDGLTVIADAHTHPGIWVGQSRIDQAHPMVALPGHIALILPNFAQGKVRFREVGVHEYRGEAGWIAHTHESASQRFRIGRWP